MPLLLSLALCCHLAILGRAVFHLLGVRLGRERTWLLSPAMGTAVIGLLIMGLNQAGLPIRSFALPLALLTTVFSGAVLARRRLSPPSALRWFGVIALLALFAAGWPLLLYGWNWVGYGNDDMGNYCLGADRFLRHGFYAVPTFAELEGGDYAQMFWMLHVAGQIRFASEQLLAYVAGCTRLGTIQIFLPTLLALGLVQLTAFMGLVFHFLPQRKEALIAGLLLAAAPLWYYGLMYQLIAQVSGLALLTAVLVLIARSRFPVGWRSRLRLAAASALLLAGLCITYPEVLPFLVLGWALFIGSQAWRARRWPRGLLPTALMAALLVAFLLRHNLLSTVLTLGGQAQDGLNANAQAARVALFPYFLMSAGPAFLLGLDVIVARWSEPWVSIAVVAGWLGAAGLFAVWLARWRRPAISTTILAVMVPVAVLLYRSGNGFGLFKLSMFALPFLLAELARALGRGRTWVAILLVLAGGLAWAPAIWRYTVASTNLAPSVVGELFDASSSRGEIAPGPAWADTTSSPINKLLMLEGAGSQPVFMSQIVGAVLLGKSAEPFPPLVWRFIPGQADGKTAQALAHHVENEVYRRKLALGLRFWDRLAAHEPAPGQMLITSEAERRSFNKWHHRPPAPGLFHSVAVKDLHNHLVFVQSQQGQHYYLGTAGSISVYRPQRDSYDAAGDFFVIGRHLLFRVLNPGPEVRLRLAITGTVLGEGRTGLPAEAAAKDGSGALQRFGLMGAGSANVFSPPLKPLLLDGAAYVALDLGQAPLPIGLRGRGLQGALDRDLSIDTRLGLAYCRDISLLDENEYAHLPRKRSLDRFPADLLGPDALEYSGFYEDGWVSNRAFVVLGPAVPGDQIVIQGQLPRLPGRPDQSQAVELVVDGNTVLRQEIVPGDFKLVAPIRAAGAAIRIELRFSHALPLPDPDNRPVSILLKSISLRSAP